MTKTYFFDSYAIIEILKGNKNYQKYIEYDIVLTKLNLFEVFYRLFHDSEEKAKIFLEIYSKYVVDFDEEIIEASAKLKLMNKKLSMADCIGYAIALKHEIKFLTGDQEFKDVSNVEFVR